VSLEGSGGGEIHKIGTPQPPKGKLGEKSFARLADRHTSLRPARIEAELIRRREFSFQTVTNREWFDTVVGRGPGGLTSCVFSLMKLKTVSVVLEAFHLMRQEKTARESYGDVVRRIFAERAAGNYDPSEHLNELFAEFWGTGVLTAAGRARVQARKSSLPRSRRPSRAV